MINNLESIESMESLREDLWEKIWNEKHELKGLMTMRDTWVNRMGDDKDKARNRMDIELKTDKIKMLLKSYALITGEISRLCQL